MSGAASVTPVRRRTPGRVRTFWSSLRTVLTHELRWRMRGRRAFVVATLFVLLLGLLVLGIHQLLAGSLGSAASWMLEDPVDGRRIFSDDVVSAGMSGAASTIIGASIYSAMLVTLTILVMLVAPALSSGVISTEREKQTLELLVTTPVSSLGLVTGKLVASLVYVVLLLIASVPVMSVAFVFGGVGPEDVVRAYAVVFAVAFGMGALGLFLSALLGRTQLATVVSYIVVLVLTLGLVAVHGWLYVTSVDDQGRNGVIEQRRHAPEPLLWLSPAVADADVLCSALPETRLFCAYTAAAIGAPEDAPTPPRDGLWPKVVASLLVFGATLTLLSTQLISPSRGIRAGRRRRRVARSVQTAGGGTASGSG